MRGALNEPGAGPDGAMVLGVDAGSTTTKAILLDPASHGVVASYYTRTKGDPVAATRERGAVPVSQAVLPRAPGWRWAK